MRRFAEILRGFGYDALHVMLINEGDLSWPSWIVLAGDKFVNTTQ